MKWRWRCGGAGGGGRWTSRKGERGVRNAAVCASFPEAIQNGTAELYWCQQSDCSDRQLAGVGHFTITAASSSLAAPGQSLPVDLLRERHRILSFSVIAKGTHRTWPCTPTSHHHMD